MGIKEHRRESGTIVDDRRWCGLRHTGQGERSVDTTTVEAVDCIERIAYIVLFKGRIAAGVTEKIAEHAVMEDSERRSYSGFAIAPRIPGKTNSRLDVRIVAIVNLLAGSGADHSHC